MIAADRYTDWVFYICLFITGVFIGAGGQGIAVSAALLGLLVLPVIHQPALAMIRRRPPALLLFAALIVWVCLSFLWSPYERPDQVWKLVLLTPLFLAVPFAVTLMPDDQRDYIADWTALVLLLCGAYFTLEAGSRGAIGAFVEMRFEGAENIEQARAFALRTLSRGATAYILLAGPVAIWLWRQGLPRARYAAIALSLTTLFAAAGFGVESNIVALALGLGAAGCAYRAPYLTLQVLLGATAIWLLGAPLFMSAVVTLIPESVAEALPLSWHWRLEIWTFALEQIRAAPILGHGLDSARVISDVTTLRGVEIERLPLHAHNAGLHLWLETGAVGAALAAAALLAAGRALDKARLSAHQCAGLAFVGAAWLSSVTMGYGIWQEWHIGALAIACAVALLTRS